MAPKRRAEIELPLPRVPRLVTPIPLPDHAKKAPDNRLNYVNSTLRRFCDRLDLKIFEVIVNCSSDSLFLSSDDSTTNAALTSFHVPQTLLQCAGDLSEFKVDARDGNKMYAPAYVDPAAFAAFTHFIISGGLFYEILVDDQNDTHALNRALCCVILVKLGHGMGNKELQNAAIRVIFDLGKDRRITRPHLLMAAESKLSMASHPLHKLIGMILAYFELSGHADDINEEEDLVMALKDDERYLRRFIEEVRRSKGRLRYADSVDEFLIR